MFDTIFSPSLLLFPGPYVLEVTGEPVVVTATSREVDLQTTQDPGPLQKPIWQVSSGRLYPKSV